LPPHTHIHQSKVFVYEIPNRDQTREVIVDDDFLEEEEAKTNGIENVDDKANPYLKPYIYKSCFRDTQYGTPNYGDISKIGDSAVS
jgi:hypothetical protein